jgi:uncharacterized protein YjiS (DUF1127 family)
MGTPENGVITQGIFSLDEFLGLQTPAGLITQSLDITNDLTGTFIARITVEEVLPAPVPLPAAAPYLLTALGSLALARRRLKAKVRGEGKAAGREGWKALFGRMGRGTGSVLLQALNAIAECDQRHREELRLRGVSDDFLKDVGLTRRQFETAYSRQVPLSLGRLQRATAMPSG